MKNQLSPPAFTSAARRSRWPAPGVVGPVDRVRACRTCRSARRWPGRGVEEDLVSFPHQPGHRQRHRGVAGIGDPRRRRAVEPLAGDVGADIGLVLVVGLDRSRPRGRDWRARNPAPPCGWRRPILAGRGRIRPGQFGQHANADGGRALCAGPRRPASGNPAAIAPPRAPRRPIQRAIVSSGDFRAAYKASTAPPVPRRPVDTGLVAQSPCCRGRGAAGVGRPRNRGRRRRSWWSDAVRRSVDAPMHTASGWQHDRKILPAPQASAVPALSPTTAPNRSASRPPQRVGARIMRLHGDHDLPRPKRPGRNRLRFHSLR